MNKENNGGSVLLWIITVALIIYTGSRSYDLISKTLPADQQITGFFALAALDGGLLAWLFWTTGAAAPGTQQAIGTLMIIVCIVGIAAAVLGDTMMNFDPSTKEGIGTIAVWVTGFIIVANIMGFTAATLADPKQAMRNAERAVTHELQRQKAEHLINNAPEIASHVAAIEAKHHADQMVAAFQQTGMSKNGNGNGQTTYQKDAPFKTFAVEAKLTDWAWEQKFAQSYPNESPQWGEVEEDCLYTLQEAIETYERYKARPINVANLYRIIDKETGITIIQDQEPQTAEPLPGKAPRPRSRAS